GYVLEETIREVDAEAGRLAYAIANPPMPLTGFEGVVETREGDDGTTIVWTANFDAKEENVEMLRTAMIGQYQAGIAALELAARA
ncbi:MAG: SRPBCC family protein, partial [Pseudomonadota bacterium]